MEDTAGSEILAQAVRQGFQKTPFKVRLPWHPCSPFTLTLACCMGCGPVLGAEAALFCGTKMEASGEIQGPLQCVPSSFLVTKRKILVIKPVLRKF